ncbi:UDP-N-acetylglucosamine 1-carboxyvinyltransferase [Candidatus Babeliales bacterium]|nr:UDP-N-acetylglucosamine 1-carboxyvinyltransferase [Candidatus Babeliales bacterium]MBP9843647.1 UDP-N-acetylglucosamine 1-carboxyvinyltransferase [Candidatus Babeliales bacterium]
MHNEYILVKKSGPLMGNVLVSGAKNAALPIMASLILTSGVSVLKNVPHLTDIESMVVLLQELGAVVHADYAAGTLTVDTTHINRWKVSEDLMKKTRASIVVLGPLLARFHCADLAFPGGDAIGARPIDYHLKNFKKMGAAITQSADLISLQAETLTAQRFVLDYPSVGATQNILMAAVLVPGSSYIINAAMEPEVMDLIKILQKMGAKISIEYPATLKIVGVEKLHAVEYEIMTDRLEAGALLIAAAITGGQICLPNASAQDMELFLSKLEEMGHEITVDEQKGVCLKASTNPQAVSIKTAPYPGIATDLQPLIMIAQAMSQGKCEMIETVFENRFLHVPYLQKMGALMEASGHKATITGVQKLQGADVEATDIRASCALVLAGLVADGTTKVFGVPHWRRGYESLDQKLRDLGASIEFVKIN